jgi:uncharacterized protein (TIGR02145 family)
MKQRILVLSIIVLSFLFSCSKDSSTNPVTFTITSINPNNIKAGDTITIIGSGFGATQNKSFVSFNNIAATQYSSWSNTVINVKVPFGVTSGKLSVTVDGKKSNEIDFTIIELNLIEVTIGTQVWKTKNLDVDHYRNGEPIPNVTDSVQWANLTTGAWCYYNNDPALGAIYGKLYNWYAITDPRGLAPAGWHIPSDSEWKTLTDYLGYEDVAGSKLKEAGTAHWSKTNADATNESGFTALPGGYRIINGTFDTIGSNGDWWSSTENNATEAWVRDLYFGGPWVGKLNPNKGNGFSIRCVKD